MAPTLSGYNGSKFALLKVIEALCAENLDLHVVSMHPGVGTCHQHICSRPKTSTAILVAITSF
jgi:hypothetical protein